MFLLPGPEVYSSSVGRAGLYLGVWALMLCFCAAVTPQTLNFSPTVTITGPPEQRLTGEGMGAWQTVLNFTQ